MTCVLALLNTFYSVYKKLRHTGLPLVIQSVYWPIIGHWYCMTLIFLGPIKSFFLTLNFFICPGKAYFGGLKVEGQLTYSVPLFAPKSFRNQGGYTYRFQTIFKSYGFMGWFQPIFLQFFPKCQKCSCQFDNVDKLLRTKIMDRQIKLLSRYSIVIKKAKAERE